MSRVFKEYRHAGKCKAADGYERKCDKDNPQNEGPLKSNPLKFIKLIEFTTWERAQRALLDLPKNTQLTKASIAAEIFRIEASSTKQASRRLKYGSNQQSELSIIKSSNSILTNRPNTTRPNLRQHRHNSNALQLQTKLTKLFPTSHLQILHGDVCQLTTQTYYSSLQLPIRWTLTRHLPQHADSCPLTTIDAVTKWSSPVTALLRPLADPRITHLRLSAAAQLLLTNSVTAKPPDPHNLTTSRNAAHRPITTLATTKTLTLTSHLRH